MQLLTLTQRKKRPVHSLAFAPDGRALVASSNLAVPTLWELPATGAPVPLSSSSVPPAFAFTFSPDARVVGWLCGSGRFERDRDATESRVAKLVPDNEMVMMQATCGTDGRLVLRTSVRGSPNYCIRGFKPDGKEGWAEEWTVGPDDVRPRVVAGASRADRFFAWEVVPVNQTHTKRLVVRSALTGAIEAEVPMTIWYVVAIAAAPDGSLAVCFKDSSLWAWHPGNKVEKVRTGTLKYYRALAFHPDGRHLLAGNNDTTARLIDTQSWQVVRQYAWDIGTLTAVAVSPDGALAAAGGSAGRVVVWDLDI